uniref:Uncharacterized protein n=1 Tax=Timema cristinae TaxID=61476 RepID=A0A7R9D6F9_TIMCR|nr:unnamed protein product [Timema cristinae]
MTFPFAKCPIHPLFRDVLTNYFCSEVPQSRYQHTDLVWTSFLTSLFQNIFSRIEEIHSLERQHVEFITEDEPWLHCKAPHNFSREVANNWYWSHRKKFWQVQNNHWAYSPNIEPISKDSPDSSRRESVTHSDKKCWDTSRMKIQESSSVDKRAALERSDQAQSGQGEEEAPSLVASVKSKARARRRKKLYQTLRSDDPLRD